MPVLTIADLEPDANDELRRRAVATGRSPADEARSILQGALGNALPQDDDVDLYTYIRSLVEPIGGADDLVVPMRDICREPPSFDDWDL